MTIMLSDQLVTNFVDLLLEVKGTIDSALRTSLKVIDTSMYVILRQKLRSFSRFCDLGRMVLLDKTEQSRNVFGNVDEVALLLKVHYKWLKKFINLLQENREQIEHPTIISKGKPEKLKAILSVIDSNLMSVYDPFRKICKVYRKYINSPLPCSSDIVLKVCSMLQAITGSLSPSRNKYIGTNLVDEPKFITLQTEDGLRIRSQLIALWYSIYANETLEEEILGVLQDMNKFCETRMNVTESSEESDRNDQQATLSPKEIVKMAPKVQMWPLHEYMYMLFVGMFQKKLCEKLALEQEDVSLPSTYLSAHHSNMPNIPIELLAILDTILAKQDNAEERNRLTFALFIWFLKFSEDSYGIKKFKQVRAVCENNIIFTDKV